MDINKHSTKIENKECIGIYTTSAFPYGKAAESLVRSMALGLKENNIYVVIKKIRGDSFNQGNDLDIENDYVLFKKRPKTELKKAIELFFLIMILPWSVFCFKIKHKPTSILLYGIEYAYIVIPLRITCKLLNIRLYRIVTDEYSDNVISPKWWKRPKLYFYNLQSKYIDKKLDGIICLSRYLYNKSLDNGVKKENVCLIPHFINAEKFEIENKHNINKKKRIGYSGTLSEANGIIDLLHAFRNILSKESSNNIELYIVGDIESVSQVVKSEIKDVENYFPGSVVFKGFLSTAKIPKFLNSCDILVNPRKNSKFAEAGFPTKLGEYFASKKPVVATAVGDIAFYFKNENELILAEPDNPNSLADKILMLINNEDLSKEIMENGYQWMRDNLYYITSAKKLLEFMNYTIR